MNGAYVTDSPGTGRFPLAGGGRAAPLVVSAADYPGVVRVVDDLQGDIESVTGVKPTISYDQVPPGADIVVVGTIGRSPLVDGLVAAGRLDVGDIEGKWETTLETVVNHPWPGVDRAFVIAGGDQLGTIYGAYDLSKEIGVSPWHWWDDVTPAHRDALYVLPGRHSQGTPAVKYRGFFINDENPNLGTWGPQTFGPGLATGFPDGFNHKLYAKVFEVALRLKANYLWPATWGRAFWADDPENQATANYYGIYIGTSHEAPMMSAIDEWNRNALPAVRDERGNVVAPGRDPYGGTGEWSFRYNSAAIGAHWTRCMERYVAQHNHGPVTIGMRGNGDTALADDAGIELMTEILGTQRQIIEKANGKAVENTPQIWTLYKEVLRYWDEGLRPPDDVTVVFTDDNWGNIRELPDRQAPLRAGGYGLYYHFDYVGGGRNYKWVDTASIPNTWEQLHAAYAYGVRRLWMFNVGDMKNLEEPLQFSLDYAWNPNRWNASNLDEWIEGYATQNFGPRAGGAIGEILAEYGHLQSQRKPELLNRKITIDPAKNLPTDPTAVVYDDQATPYSINNYQELDRVTAQWQDLAARAEAMGADLPASKQAAFYELVLYEVKATANLYAMRAAEFKNLLHASQGRATTNDLAAEAEARFADDQVMMAYYNTELAGGKWHGWNLQPHIDYGDVARYGPDAPWQQPQMDDVAIPDVLFPDVERIALPPASEMGVAIDGADGWWPNASCPAVLPAFSPYQTAPAQYIDVFNRGATPFGYSIAAAEPWVRVASSSGTVDKQVRATVGIDWDRAPRGTTTVPITISGAGRTVTVEAVVENPDLALSQLAGFVEAGGYVSIDAANYSRAVNAGGAHWRTIPRVGRTGSGVEPFPQTARPRAPGPNGARLEYEMTLFSTGRVTVWAYLSPRNDVLAHGGLRYAISVDDEAPQILNITTATGADEGTMNEQWERNTSNNVNLTSTTFTISTPGLHTLKFWMVDPTIVAQKFVVDTGGLRWSYLGPPQSLRLG